MKKKLKFLKIYKKIKDKLTTDLDPSIRIQLENKKQEMEQKFKTIISSNIA